MADVFISYHRGKASQFVMKIADALEERNLSSWYMERDSDGYYADIISQEINSCRIFLLILDEGSNKSEDVRTEASLAYNRHRTDPSITIVPVRIDNCDLCYEMMYYLTRLTWHSGDPQSDPFVYEIANRIVGILDKKKRALLPIQPPTQPRKFIKSGSCGDGVIYMLDANGVMTIAGAGEMEKYGFTALTPWWSERENIFFIEIQNHVSSIGDSAFAGCVNLSGIIIPACVTAIGWAAFQGCASLTSVTIPDEVEHIDGGTFQHCTSLINVNIPKKVTSIGNWAFDNCINLTNIHIPDSVTYIGVGAFDNCANLSNVSVPASAKMDDDAFPENTNVTVRIRRK